MSKAENWHRPRYIVSFSELYQDGKKLKRQHKCLLLGCGEAGKSTFIKQMRIMNNHTFTDEELTAYKQQISVNIHSAITKLCDELNAKELDSMGKTPELLEAMDQVQAIKTVSPATIFDSAAIIKTLWECEEIQATYLRRNEFQIEECARYFLSRVDQVMEKSYTPTMQDIVQIRERTTGIVEHHFVMNNPNAMGPFQSKPQTVILVSQ